MKKPNFFILGAPKCGTTSLAHWLAGHPAVFMCPSKEPSHFYCPFGSAFSRSAYEALFSEAMEEHRAVGEASTCYLYSSDAISKIITYQPKAKFVVCVRNPSEMAISLHNEQIVQGRETELSFEKAWRLSDARLAGETTAIAGPTEPSYMAYKSVCALGTQIEQVSRLAGRANLCVVVLDDIKVDPRSQYRRVVEFLGLKDDGKTEFTAENPAVALRSLKLKRALRFLGDAKRKLNITRDFGLFAWLHVANEKRANYREIPHPLRIELGTTFSTEVRKLEEYLGRNFSHWTLQG